MADDDNVIRFPLFARFDAEMEKVFGPDHLRCYKLVGHKPVKLRGMAQWSEEFSLRQRALETTGEDPWRVAFTDFGTGYISTVFLGLDHRFFGDGPPILFETMIFGGRLDHFQNRCCTWDEAEKMHEDAVAQVKAGNLRVVK